jgi:hypothetical protein
MKGDSVLYIIQSILELRYEEKTGLEVFLHKFNNLYSKTATPNDMLTKLAYLTNCLNKSKNNPFHTTLTILNNSGNADFQSTVEALHRRDMELKTRDEIKRRSNSDYSLNMNTELDDEEPVEKKRKTQSNKKKIKRNNEEVYLNQPTNDKEIPVCSHCNMKWHTVENCFDIVPCSICNKLGHGPKTCREKKNSNSNSNFSNNVRGDKSSSGTRKKSDPSKIKASFIRNSSKFQGRKST